MKRLVTVLLGMLGLFAFLHAVDADAMTKAGSSQPPAISRKGISIERLAVSAHALSSENKL